jgi:hypothetical protein
MAPLHGGSSAGKSDLCYGHSLDVVGRPGSHQSGLMSICFAGCFSPGPRKNDLTIYWALGPFVRSFTLLVDPGDIYPPQDINIYIIILFEYKYKSLRFLNIWIHPYHHGNASHCWETKSDGVDNHNGPGANTCLLAAASVYVAGTSQELQHDA